MHLNECLDLLANQGGGSSTNNNKENVNIKKCISARYFFSFFDRRPLIKQSVQYIFFSLCLSLFVRRLWDKEIPFILVYADRSHTILFFSMMSSSVNMRQGNNEVTTNKREKKKKSDIQRISLHVTMIN